MTACGLWPTVHGPYFGCVCQTDFRNTQTPAILCAVSRLLLLFTPLVCTLCQQNHQVRNSLENHLLEAHCCVWDVQALRTKLQSRVPSVLTCTPQQLHPHLLITAASPAHHSTLTCTQQQLHLTAAPPAHHSCLTCSSQQPHLHTTAAPPSPAHHSSLTCTPQQPHLLPTAPSLAHHSSSTHTCTPQQLHPHLLTTAAPPSPAHHSSLTCSPQQPHLHTTVPSPAHHSSSPRDLELQNAAARAWSHDACWHRNRYLRDSNVQRMFKVEHFRIRVS